MSIDWPLLVPRVKHPIDSHKKIVENVKIMSFTIQGRSPKITRH